MRGHIADDQWIDVADGVAAPEVRAHLEACAACRATAGEVRGGWSLAREADVPEPSPLYWESFRRRVGQAIAEESAPRARWRFPLVGALAAAASLVVAVSMLMMNSPSAPVLSAPVATLDAWSALPADEDDEALPVLVAVSSSEYASDVACGSVDTCVLDLSDDEVQGVEDALRQELAL
jgi:hypothetical protein